MTLKEHLNRFWERETLGIESNSIYETFKNEIYFDGQHYITSLTFKPYHKPIQDNFMLSKHKSCCATRQKKQNKTKKQTKNKMMTKK